MSDPQERAWYDSHRDAILKGDDELGGGFTEAASFRNVRLTSTEEILALIRRFSSAVPFNDDPHGFFSISRETFEHLAIEEEAAAGFDNTDCPDYPTFGSSDDPYDSVVKPFYNVWTGFSTKKSFSWKDKYRLADAPDRRVRRLMEKENKKIRDDAIREFNDAVRFLVTFVRKRDPRYNPHTQTEAERQKSMRDAAAAQAARSRAANHEKIASYEMPEWARPKDDPAAHQFSEDDEDSDSEIELLECVICNKTFKSDKQLEAHERSKKHIKAVQHLRREMRKEGADLEIDKSASFQHEQDSDQGTMKSTVEHAPVEAESNEAGGDIERGIDGFHESDDKEPPMQLNMARGGSDIQTDTDGDDYAPRSVIQERLMSDTAPVIRKHDSSEELAAAAAKISVSQDQAPRKIGRAKAKREKKAAASRSQAEQVSSIEQRLVARGQIFGELMD